MLNHRNFARTALLAAILVPGLCLIYLGADEITVEEDFASLPEYRVFGTPATPSDEAAIFETMQRFGAAWGSQDVDAAVSTYTEDVEWTNAFADVYRGRDELQGQFSQLFERFESDPDPADQEDDGDSRPPMKRGMVSLRYIGDDAAVVHSYTESDWGTNRDGSDLRRVHITFVLEKQADGQWLIAHQMIMDARR